MIGDSDGNTYDSATDHALSRPVPFEERAEPVKKAIASGDMDPVGGNYTDFNSSGRTEANFEKATKDMNLNPQEQGLYKRHLDNLWGSGGVDNKDGTRSSLYSSTVTFGDKAYIVPGVHEGRILSNEEADAKAKAEGLDNLPSYATHEEANKRYQQMHDYMEKDTNAYEQYKQNRMPSGAPQEPTGALKGATPILPTGSFQQHSMITGDRSGEVKLAADKLGHGSDINGPYAQHPKWEELPKERQDEIFNTWGTIHGEASDKVPTNEKDFYKELKGGSFGVLSNHPKINDVLKTHPSDVERYDIPFGEKTLHFFVKKTPLVSQTDEQPDEIKAGQKYAMSEKKAFPQEEGLDAEINAHATGLGARIQSGQGPGKATYKPTENPVVPKPKSAPEKVNSAAIKFEDGHVIEGKSHFDAVQKSFETGHDKKLDSAIDGFTTSTGRFVDRREALKIFEAAEQEATKFHRPDSFGLRSESVMDIMKKEYDTSYLKNKRPFPTR